MHDFPLPFHSRHADRDDPQLTPAMFALGLWIRLGCIGTAAFVAALVALIDPETSAGAALAVAAASAIVAALAWSSVRRALRAEDTGRRKPAQRASLSS
jgi:hypothetical protein